ncbi:hypothetical protein STEG23_033962, partial [Scotinomys teguina]
MCSAAYWQPLITFLVSVPESRDVWSQSVWPFKGLASRFGYGEFPANRGTNGVTKICRSTSSKALPIDISPVLELQPQIPVHEMVPPMFK